MAFQKTRPAWSSSRPEKHSQRLLSHLVALVPHLRDKGLSVLISRRITLKVGTTHQVGVGSVSHGPPELDVWGSDGERLGTITVDEVPKGATYVLCPPGGKAEPLWPVSDPEQAASALAAIGVLGTTWSATRAAPDSTNDPARS
ncbi:hypothetical protein [Sphaerisporangium fuscum]|uniref:hypothetical protein n=1 Tax=Sphaerisporangium fuscum TaxID=2835868 RepID=UPI001BDBDCDF|nr:hypothetical protein [Sphaerisporangium fuscum]